MRKLSIWGVAVCSLSLALAACSKDDEAASGDGDGDGTGSMSGDGDGDGSGGTPGDGDGDGAGGTAEGGMGGTPTGQGGMGGMGGASGALGLGDACEARCAVTTDIGCPNNEDVSACENECNTGASGCDDEWLALKNCEAQLEASDWMCIPIPNMERVAPSGGKCAKESNAWLGCAF